MRRHLLAAAALLMLAGSQSALAADPTGVWLTQPGTSRIRVADCGGALCGTIIWLKEPNDPDTGKAKTDKHNSDAARRSRPLMGVQIMLGMKPAGDGKWTGQVYNAEDGKTYGSDVTPSGASQLKVRGCVFKPFCKTQTWTRVR